MREEICAEFIYAIEPLQKLKIMWNLFMRMNEQVKSMWNLFM